MSSSVPQWIHQHHNVLITGPTGCGKTYLGCVLATQACRHGLSVRYFRTSRLLESLSIAHGDGRFSKLIVQLAKVDVLVLDDWGLEKMSLGQRNDLLEIMEDRHGLRSTLITSQLPIAGRERPLERARAEAKRCRERRLELVGAARCRRARAPSSIRSG